MSDLLQIFTGNPMSTFMGKKIEAATRPELESEDWALNMEICDIINENDDDAKDAARAIRKRLQQIEQDRNFTITNRTLTVLETCVNNCSHRFHILVMTKDFIQDLVKLIGPKNNPPIDLQERVLSLIENWADAFRNQPDLGGVVSVYSDLKAKGVTFPPRDPNSRVPIQTPQRTVPVPAPTMAPTQGQAPRSERRGRPVSAAEPGATPTYQILLEGAGYDKISNDLTVVQSSIEMFKDILEATAKGGAGADWQLLDELSVTCRQMKDRIVDLIERIANEDLTIELLRLNDELNNQFIRYESLCDSRPTQTLGNEPAGTRPATSETTRPSEQQRQSTGPVAPTSGDPVGQPRPKLAGVSSNTLNELSLIDFEAARANEIGQTGSGNKVAGSATGVVKQQTANQSGSVDPFDTSNVILGAGQQASLADELRGLDIGGNQPTKTALTSLNQGKKPAGSNVPEEISSVREQDFAEIENWLSTDSGRDLASIGGDMPSVEPISVPNSEFDNFIASRALAGSSASGQQQQSMSQKKPEPSV